MELFKLLGTIAINNTEANNALDETVDKGKQTESKMSGAMGKIGKAATKMGKAVVAGIGAGTVAIGKLTKDATQAYADYEQLQGGIETLFGTGGLNLYEYAESLGKTVDEVREEYMSLALASNEVISNSFDAFKKAGLSENEYMETVTGFSASLIQSLSGDTQKAAKLADQAVVDMSDNANKMGTSMEMIQNAYQGFAKQNYTMLDNLKLGYGGTKNEMQRLLEDAEKISGIKYDLSNFADLTEAIHVIQTEMGITGTTAKEASETISGSINMVKAQWKNLLTYMGTEDYGQMMPSFAEDFADTVSVALDNIIPRLELILGGITDLLSALAPKIAKAIPVLVEKLLPPIVEGAITLVDGLVQAMPAVIDALMGILPSLIEGIITITKRIAEALPDIIRSIIEALPTLLPILIQGIADIIVILANTLPDLIQPIIDNLPIIITAIVTAIIACVPQLFEAGVNLVLGLLEGMISLVKNIPQILKAIFDAIVGGIKALFGIHSPSTVMMEIGRWIMEGLFQGIRDLVNGISEIWEHLKGITVDAFSGIKDAVTSAWEGIKSGISDGVEAIKNLFSNMVDAAVVFKDNLVSGLADLKEKAVAKFQELKDSASQKVSELKETIVSKATELKDKASAAFSGIADKAVEGFNNLREKGSAAIERLSSSFTTTFGNMWNTVVEKASAFAEKFSQPFENAKDKVRDIVSSIKEFFNFNWELPKIKLPHFNISYDTGGLLGSLATKIGLPGIPKFDVEWYKDGGIMNDPTAFGFNPYSGKVMAGGEAGPEAIAPISTLQSYVQEAVSESNYQLYQALNQILALLTQYFPQLANKQLVLDTGALVGELAEPMNEELGKITYMRGRWN